MWTLESTTDNSTSKYIVPADGIISVTKPEGVKVFPYVNDVTTPIHHVHVKAGDTVYFKLENTNDVPTSVTFEYAGTAYPLTIPAQLLGDEVVAGTTEEEDMTPAETINLFANPGMGGMGGAGAGAGAGLGAGLLGGVLGGALLGGRGGLLGNGVDGSAAVTPAFLASSLAQVTDTAQATVVLQTLGDIKASIPLAEGQVQLALAGAQADINGNISAGLQVAVAGQGMINKNISDAIAASLASQNNINVNILQQAAAGREVTAQFGVANLTATKDAQYATGVAISNSTKEILAALNDQNTANLQRQLTVAEQALLEQRANSRSRETEVNVTQTVNQNQNQLQAQAQQQQQFLITNNLLQAILSQAQVAQATNQSLIIGNTGAVVGGPQNANPTNVRA